MLKSANLQVDPLLNRKILKAIYSDIQDLASAWQKYLTAKKEPDKQPDKQIDWLEIGFHFYEGIARLVRKMQSASIEPERQIWAMVEELRLLFDAHALSIEVLTKETENLGSIEDYIWQSASFTVQEEELLHELTNDKCSLPYNGYSQLFKNGSLLQFRSFKKPVSILLKPAPKNYSLQAVDAIFIAIVAPSPLEDGTILPLWKLCAFMETTKTRKTAYRSREFCDYLLPSDQTLRKTTAKSFLNALSRIIFPSFHPLKKTRLTENLFTGDESEDINRSDTIETFLNYYEQHFAPVANVLHQLSDRIKLILGICSQEDNSRKLVANFTIMFSFYNSGTNSLSFFPLSGDEIWERILFDELKPFFEFKYLPEWALNGWVLSTGFCYYTEDFINDPLWEIPFDRDSKRDNTKASKKQKKVVSKVFKSDTQPFAFLLPLFAEWDENSETLKPLLMLSITRSQPFNRPLRRQILDQAWNAFHEIEMALHTQVELNKSFEIKRQNDAIHLNRALGHSLPKFVFKPLEYYSLLAGRNYATIQFNENFLTNLPAKKLFSKFTQHNINTQEALIEGIDAVDNMMFFIKKGSYYLKSLISDLSNNKTSRQRTSIFPLFFELSRVFEITYEMYIRGRLDGYDNIQRESRSYLLREWAITSPAIKIKFFIDGVEITPNMDIKEKNIGVEVPGDHTTLSMHLHNVIENAINSITFKKISIDNIKRLDDIKQFSITISATCSKEIVEIKASDTGSPIDLTLINYLRTMFKNILSSPSWERSTQGKQVIEEIRKSSSAEGSGQGLLRFVQYIRSVWDGSPKPNSAEIIQNEDGEGKTLVFRLPIIHSKNE